MTKINGNQKRPGKKTLEQLNQSKDKENFFQNIVETIREPVVILDVNLKVFYANPNFYKTFKVQREDTIGKLFFHLGNKQWKIPALQELLEDIIVNHTVITDFQVDHEFLSIGRRIMIINARQIVNPELKNALILLAIDDITERLLDEEVMRKSEERFRRAFETAQDSIVLVEKLTGQIMNSNQAAAKLLGYTSAELLNMKIWKLGFLGNEKEYRKDARKLEDLGFIDYFDSSVLTKQGEAIPAEIYLTNRAKVFQCNIRNITERKQGKEDLLQISTLLTAISMNNPDHIIVQDKDLKYIFVHNPQLGLTEQEMLGKSDYEIGLQEEEAEKLVKIKTQVLETGKIVNYMTSLQSKRGGVEYFDGQFSPNTDEKGNITGLIGYFRNITKSKTLEQELSESEEKYRNVVERANDGIAVIRDGIVKFANPRLAELWGSTDSEILNTPFTNYIAPNDLEKVADRYRRRMAGETIDPIYEVALLKKNGEKVIAELSAGVISYEGKPANLVIVRDVTERKEAERLLRNEQEKALKYLDIAEVMIVALDMDGEILLINQKGMRVLGYQENELIGKNWFDTCVPEQYRRDVREVHRKVLTGDLERVEWHENAVLTKSGEERIIAWNNSDVFDENKRLVGTLSSGEDITQRVRTEKLLNGLNKASVAMSIAVKQQDIFTALSKVLNNMGIACMLFFLDETRSRLEISYLSFEQKVLNKIERLIGVDQQSISFLVDNVDVYRKAVREKVPVFTEDSESVVRQVLPNSAKMFASKIVDILHVQKGIFSPLIVENQVLGVLTINSNSLTVGDLPAITAFAHQLAGAWKKADLIKNLNKTVEGTVRAIAATSEMRDPYTAGHQERVSDLATAIATEMRLLDEQVESVRMAGLVHDLGKIKIPAEILGKPGKLSDMEFKLIKLHPQDGFDLLKEVEFPWPLAQIVLQHHEKIDGSGYPNGLKGDEIMIEARILTVADIVEAMSSHRPYRSGLGIDKALSQINQDRGKLLDPQVVDACLRVFENGYKIAPEE